MGVRLVRAMNSIKIILILLIGIGSHRDLSAADSGSLVVRIVGLKSSVGFVHYALFDSKKAFPKHSRAIRTGSFAIEQNQCDILIEKLAFGEYAIAVGHDRNNNGKIDRILGIPTEPVGVSGYEKKLWSPPRFEKSKIRISDERTIITVHVF